MQNLVSKVNFLSIFKSNFNGLLIFGIIPLLYSEFLLDYDLLPKTIGILSWSILLFLFHLFSNKKISLNVNTFSATILLFSFLFIIWTFWSTSKSINFQEGAFETTRILLPFFLILPSILFLQIIPLENNVFKLIHLTVGILVSFGIYQLFHLFFDHPDNHHLFYIDFSIRSTLANKNFFSECLLLCLPFTMAGYFHFKDRWKTISLISSMVIVGFIIILQTLSVWLGLIFSISVFILIHSRIYFPKAIPGIKIKKSFLLISFLLLLLLLGFVFKDTWIFEPLRTKAKSIHAFYQTNIQQSISADEAKNTNSLFERLYLWKNTIKLIQENPWTGLGAGNWILYWPKYGIGGATYLSSGAMHFEHPHNEYLLIFAEYGIIGFILFIAILISLVLTAAKTYMATEDICQKKIVLLMLLGILSFCILCFFGYPIHRPFSALLFSLTAATIILKSSVISKPNRIIASYKFLSWPWLICCSGLLFISAQRLHGEKYLRKAFKNQTGLNFPRMLVNVREAQNLYFHLDQTGTPLDWYMGFAHFHSGHSDSAYYYFKKAELQNPYHVQVLSDIGASLENMGRHADAIKYFEKLLLIIPNYKEGRFNLSIAYYNSGKLSAAFEEINTFTWDHGSYTTALTVISREFLNKQLDSLSLPIEKIIQMKACIQDDKKLLKLLEDSKSLSMSLLKTVEDSCITYH